MINAGFMQRRGIHYLGLDGERLFILTAISEEDEIWCALDVEEKLKTVPGAAGIVGYVPSRRLPGGTTRVPYSQNLSRFLLRLRKSLTESHSEGGPIEGTHDRS